MRLEGKVAIVTGGASGIGEAISLTFGREGAKVGVVTDRNVDGANQVVRRILDGGGSAMAVQANVSKSGDVERMVREIADAYGKLDILVNSAGIWGAEEHVTKLDEEHFDQIMAINVKGTYLCCKYAIPEMVKNGRGSIVNIGSTAGLVGERPGGKAYPASKGAVIAMTRALAAELGSHNIRANVICPGYVLSPMTVKAFEDPALTEYCLRNMALSRVGLPQDVAWAAVYLASDEAEFATGVILPVDGGWTAL
jgi:NAD(P)-dependent dehydrogenase (short-subunit alcohol dehydrogenase family)